MADTQWADHVHREIVNQSVTETVYAFIVNFVITGLAHEASSLFYNNYFINYPWAASIFPQAHKPDAIQLGRSFHNLITLVYYAFT